MQIVYAKEPIPQEVNQSIFLAGPTPRSPVDPSWRPEAIQLLKERGYQGVVFVPEPRNGLWDPNPEAFIDQVDWEWECLSAADVILFWIPRDMQRFPGLTTNVEFGFFAHSNKVVLGAPESAVNMRYLRVHYAKHTGTPSYNFLHHSIDACLSKLPNTPRRDGEVHVPQHIWNTSGFQSWYSDLKLAGNRLVRAEVLWSYQKGGFFAWVLKPEIWIEAESRITSEEFVVSRTDISTIMVYHKAPNLLDSRVVLIQEFRSACRNANGLVCSLPGGSSTHTTNMATTALEELEEEVGLTIPAERLQFILGRQDNPTLSSNHSFLYAVEATEEEMNAIAQDDSIHGVGEEHIHLRVRTLQECLDDSSLSWATVGMLSQVLLS